MLFRRRGLGFGRRGFNFHFGRRSSNGFGMYNRRGGRKTGIIIGVILAILVILLVLVFSIRIKDVEVSGNKQYTTGLRSTSPFRLSRNIRSISRAPQRWRSLCLRRALWAASPI